MTEAETMKWNDDHVLGYAPMDDIHEEFLDLIEQLQSAPDHCLPERLERMQAHLVAHFDQENTWMEETAFPPRDCHIKEHEAVLKSVAEVRVLLAQGNTTVCRELARALADWFPGHATHLDSALAHWMCKKRLDGRPLVFRHMQRRVPGQACP